MNLRRTASMTTLLVPKAILSPERVNDAIARPTRPVSDKSDSNESYRVLSISGLSPIVLRGENFQEIPVITRYSADSGHSLGMPTHKSTLSPSNEIPRGRDRMYRNTTVQDEYVRELSKPSITCTEHFRHLKNMKRWDTKASHDIKFTDKCHFGYIQIKEGLQRRDT